MVCLSYLSLKIYDNVVQVISTYRTLLIILDLPIGLMDRSRDVVQKMPNEAILSIAMEKISPVLMGKILISTPNAPRHHVLASNSTNQEPTDSEGCTFDGLKPKHMTTVPCLESSGLLKHGRWYKYYYSMMCKSMTTFMDLPI